MRSENTRLVLTAFFKPYLGFFYMHFYVHFQIQRSRKNTSRRMLNFSDIFEDGNCSWPLSLTPCPGGKSGALLIFSKIVLKERYTVGGPIKRPAIKGRFSK